MPELPEVETVRRGLAPAMEGAIIAAVEARRATLRFALPDRFVERLSGRRVTALERRAKYLLARLDGGPGGGGSSRAGESGAGARGAGEVLVMHLGMSGSFRVEDAFVGDFAHPRNKDPKHDHVVFRLTDGAAERTVIYNDPRRFGFMDLVAADGLAAYPAFARLGIEPLGNELSGPWLAAAFAGKRTPLKAALLDQSLIAGLGNIYVAESLWRAHLSPERLAGTLAEPAMAAAADRLAVAIRQVLEEAIAAGGSTLRDHAQADGSLGYFQHSFRVYDRAGDPCQTPGCPGTIGRTVQSGRSTFWCAVCQR
jgi:formamidopyrimidine-DNA glycosylase